MEAIQVILVMVFAPLLIAGSALQMPFIFIIGTLCGLLALLLMFFEDTIKLTFKD